MVRMCGRCGVNVYCVALFRASDPKQAHWAIEAREFLRKKLIGKHVKVHVDFIRPREGEYDERECATIRYGNQNAYVPSSFFSLHISPWLNRA